MFGCGVHRKNVKMNSNDLLISLRRTLVPIVVGVIVGSFIGPHVDPDALQSVVSGVVSATYYAVLRIVELRVPAVGVLLGARRQPVYVDVVHDDE